MLQGLNPGQLDKRIVLQTRTTAANAYNEPIETWSTLATVRAKIEYPVTGSNEQYQDAVNLAQTVVFFTIRHRTDVSSVERISYDSNTYDIEAPIAEVGRKNFLKIKARLRE